MQSKRSLRVLVVDDNRSSADALARLLSKQGDAVDAVYDGESAIAKIRQAPPDVVLTDLKMEPVDGMAVLREARAQQPPVETIVFTAYGAVDIAVRAMHLGARDFLTKPVTVEQVASRLEQVRAVHSTGMPEPQPTLDSGFLAHSPASRQLEETLRSAAGVPSPVWIEGELGSGRAYSAHALHTFGDQERGVGTAFRVRNLGRDEPWPTDGTVLLPNVDDLPEAGQRELVRQLQELPDSVRVVATAKPGGRQRVAEGDVRPELYYKLAVIVISVPPLRRRPEDIRALFQHGLELFAHRYHRSVPEIDQDTLGVLTDHYWPGNVRELLNLAERTVVLGADGFNLEVIEDSGPGLPKLEPGFSLSQYLETMERRILVDALQRSGGDRAQAGRLLGVERNTLRYKLNKYGLLDK